MSKRHDYLSKDYSPKIVQAAGVKRVNNVPLIIAISVLTVFVMLIAMVAAKRANAQHQAPEVAQVKGLKKNTLSLANEVIESHKEALIPPVVDMPINQEVPRPLPELSMPELDPGVPDAEIERIRQEKTQAFEEAVNAKTTVMVDNPHATERSAQTIAMNNQDVGANIDPSQAFKEQLMLLQGRHEKTMPQTLGGDEDDMRWHLNSRLQAPNSRYELRAGSVIPGVMISGISSELPGQIIGQVSQNVYDTPTGKYLLIPQGTKLIGLYSSDVNFGQSAVLVAWQRLVFPDGKALDIGSMPGADSAGFAGFRGNVNNHYARIYGSALFMSGIVAGITYSQNTNQTNQFGYSQPTAGSVLSEALGQQLGDVTSQLVSKNLNIAPTINVQPGYRFNIIAVKDLTFKTPYREFAYS